MNISDFISQNNNTHSVGRHFNDPDHNGLDDVNIFVLQFGRKNPDSEESLAIRPNSRTYVDTQAQDDLSTGTQCFRLKENGDVISLTVFG